MLRRAHCRRSSATPRSAPASTWPCWRRPSAPPPTVCPPCFFLFHPLPHSFHCPKMPAPCQPLARSTPINERPTPRSSARPFFPSAPPPNVSELSQQPPKQHDRGTDRARREQGGGDSEGRCADYGQHGKGPVVGCRWPERRAAVATNAQRAASHIMLQRGGRRRLTPRPSATPPAGPLWAGQWGRPVCRRRRGGAPGAARRAASPRGVRSARLPALPRRAPLRAEGGGAQECWHEL
mgnify:CR=1 FL=1